MSEGPKGETCLPVDWCFRVITIKIKLSITNQRYYNYKGIKKKDKQRSTKHTHKTKDRVTRTPLTNGVFVWHLTAECLRTCEQNK